MKLGIMRRTDIALQALRALDTAVAVLQASELADHTGATPQFIPQVLTPMVRAGWIASETGPRGGYRLTADLAERSILELIELMEGPTEDGRCVVGPADCTPGSPCALHDSWTWARAALVERLGRIPIASRTTKPARKGS
jgi:Rrf2 family protein